MKFGTVGTLISPDLDIRKQQAQRGLTGSAGEYQKVHNELVQDVTRMYFTAVFAKQQQAIADDVLEQLVDLEVLIKKIIEEAKTPAEAEGVNPGKLMTVQIGIREARQRREGDHGPQAGAGGPSADDGGGREDISVPGEGLRIARHATVG